VKRHFAVSMTVAASLFALIQLMPVARTNPPISKDISAPAQVESVLRRGCYDCHSNETRWPWYAHLAPASWIVARDVNQGRKHLNFSTWDKYSDDPGTVVRKLKGIGESSASGQMPRWYYLPAHPVARLSGADREVIAKWFADNIVVQEKLEESSH
jgi:hypothetical protein